MIKVGITQGDTNGIGYEVILKTFGDIRMTESCIPVIYGSTKIASYHRKTLDLPQVTFYQINSAADAAENKVNIINCCAEDVKIELGQASPEAGRAAFDALEKATQDLRDGLIDVLVTAPINKDSIQNDNFHFAGHTEYLEERFSQNGEKSLMILAKDKLRVALVTGHIPLSQVPQKVTKEKIIEAAKRFSNSLERDFRCGRPRIAILSLNPHAGENGMLGSEEKEVIIPAINELMEDKFLCFGPYPADGFFGSGDFAKFDGILAMYHDQGLAPFKTLAMEEGINFTAGLPVIRTSPAHGTAYAIAGKGQASDESFRQAVFTAIDIHANRSAYDEAHAHPLQKLYVERGRDEGIDLSKIADED